MFEIFYNLYTGTLYNFNYTFVDQYNTGILPFIVGDNFSIYTNLKIYLYTHLNLDVFV